MTLWACEECGGDYDENEDGAGDGLCEGCYDSRFVDAAPSLPVPGEEA